MPSDSSRPQCSGRVDKHFSGFVLQEILKTSTVLVTSDIYPLLHWEMRLHKQVLRTNDDVKLKGRARKTRFPVRVKQFSGRLDPG